MSRPCCLRRIGCLPQAVFFKPAGVPLHAVECVTLSLDEVEALRLADLNGLYQEQAAAQMKISRPTFARVIEQARRKVADALVHGKALRLEGGAVVLKGISMKIAIPVAEYRGLESPVYGHFGSAPAFALVDLESMAVEPLANRDHGHVHGACSPLKALAGARPDAVIVGGIGMGALLGLRAAGIKVYRAVDGTVADAVRQFKAAELPEITEDGACAGHGEGHSCHKS